VASRRRELASEHLLARECDTLPREPIHVTRRTPRLGGFVPAGLEQPPVGKTHQDRVQGSRFEAGFLRQIVSVTPLSRLRQQRGEDGYRLLRALARLHGTQSTYVELTVQLRALES